MAGTTPAPGYDPDHARFLLRQARAVDTEVLLLALVSFPYLQHTAEVVQAMWSEVGFKVVIELCDERLVNKKRRDRAFHAEATSCSYRWDPDGWFSRMLLSSAPSTRTSSGFKHAEVDSLIAAARRTVDRQQRLELYTRIENIVNEELPLLYLHHVTALQAGGRASKAISQHYRVSSVHAAVGFVRPGSRNTVGLFPPSACACALLWLSRSATRSRQGVTGSRLGLEEHAPEFLAGAYQ